MLGVLIAWPWLAFAPAAIFLAMYRLSGRRAGLVAGLMWLAYGGYEYQMKRRVWCGGECDIRVDLLLIYPLLAIASVVALVSWWRRRPT